MSQNKKEIDKPTGVETTGHEWDGIKELNNPAPRWWLWVFFVSCIWAVGYWVVYPAWPTLSGEGFRGGTAGNMQWTQYSQLKEQQAEITSRKAEYLERFHNASFDEIRNNSELYAFAIAGGSAAFKDNCATCHGMGGAGAKGYPNLNDDDWLWGGTPEDIYHTIKYGIRGTHADTRMSEMPAFGDMLKKEQIYAVSAYVLSLSKGEGYTEQGAAIYRENCAACHGDGGRGNENMGAPDLVDAIWFKVNGTIAGIASQVHGPKHGVMPTWEGRLDEDTIRQLTVYVHSLGGGE